MKSEMPFHGVSTVPMREICKSVFAPCDLSTFDRWSAQVMALWRGAAFREERHCAIELAKDRRARGYVTVRALPMFEEIVVSGAWWDYVDSVPSLCGAVLRDDPVAMRQIVLAWSTCPDMWKRRVSIILQRGFKQHTDLELLYACIEPSIDSREFFLRKAIGWALRDYAWFDPQEVVRYVDSHQGRLAPLSIREALKNVNPTLKRER